MRNSKSGKIIIKNFNRGIVTLKYNYAMQEETFY